jgi:hypothetical protein
MLLTDLKTESALNETTTPATTLVYQSRFKSI